VERGLGRAPGGIHGGPRPIDVDVLLLGGAEHASARMRIPHPEIVRRRFVLIPLLELDPDLRLPDGRSLARALDGLGAGQWVRPAGPPLQIG
jgi:2-amino-4-hydroxy-6-hydroxymethyldihydropteridine diphosphokinase